MASRKAFPRDPAEFDADPRIDFYAKDSKWILEDEQGVEWEFLADQRQWVQTLDEATIAQQQAAYIGNGTNTSEESNAYGGADKSEQPHSLKRKTSGSGGDEDAGGESSKAKKKKNNNKTNAASDQKNRAIYITSLPLDVKEQEVQETFSRYGLIAQGDNGQYRVKLYTDNEGNFKGDALVVYHRPESVALAITQCDETDFRYGVTGPDGLMRVSPADVSYKKQKEHVAKAGKEKKVLVKGLQKANAKLAEWDDDDPTPAPLVNLRAAKVVVLKHMFTLEELAEDPDARQEIYEDIRDECDNKFSTLGSVKNVTLFDAEPEGIATVRFSTAEAADACVQLFNGRGFGNRIVEATISTGEEDFKKAPKKGPPKYKKTDEERLEEFGKSLEEGPK